MLTDYAAIVIVTITLDHAEEVLLEKIAQNYFGLELVPFIEHYATTKGSEAFYRLDTRQIIAQCPVTSSIAFSSGIRKILNEEIYR